jgi:hypothetical protein
VTHLRKIMLEELQGRHYSEATTRYYIRAVEAFARHFRCPPDRLGPTTTACIPQNSARQGRQIRRQQVARKRG